MLGSLRLEAVEFIMLGSLRLEAVEFFGRTSYVLPSSPHGDIVSRCLFLSFVGVVKGKGVMWNK